MSLPKLLQEKYLKRFDELIAEGEEIRKGIRVTPGAYDPNYFEFGGRGHQRPDTIEIDGQRFITWRTNCASLLDQIVPANHVHRKVLESIWKITVSKGAVEGVLAIIRGIRDDFDRGLLGDLAQQVEAEIAGDYMGQAEQLLKESTRGKFDYVPAAVLAGAVLEKTLRAMAQKQNPPIDLLNSKGEPKTMNPLIDDLKKAGVLVETKAKQLRGWAGIRNDAAHGSFDKFTRPDVELMLKGIENFLGEFA